LRRICYRRHVRMAGIRLATSSSDLAGWGAETPVATAPNGGIPADIRRGPIVGKSRISYQSRFWRSLSAWCNRRGLCWKNATVAGDSMAAPATIRELVERCDAHRQTCQSGEYNEAQLRQEFLDPLFEAIGWDVKAIQRWQPPAHSHEQSLPAIVAACWPWKRAWASSLPLGCREPSAPAMVAAPQGEPPLTSLMSTSSGQEYGSPT
jgi:hypothetical protein